MSDTITDGVLRKIRLLLDRTTANGCTEAEAATAADKVAEILAAHNLTMTDAEAKATSAGDSPAARSRDVSPRSAMYSWQIDLMATLAKANFCKHWVAKIDAIKFNQGFAVKGKRHHLIGREVNVLTTNMTYDYLVDTMQRLSPYKAPNNRSREAHSWLLGCAARLTDRIETHYRDQQWASRQEKQKAKEAREARGDYSPGALVLADVYSSEEDYNNDAWMEVPLGTTARLRLEREARYAETRRQLDSGEIVIQRSTPAPAAPETPAEKKAREIREAQWEARWARQRESQRRKAEAAARRIDRSAYLAGSETGDSISLSKQIDADRRKALK